MRIEYIQLKNFRIFQELIIVFSKGLNFIVGLNGQGKTSILEAMYLLSSSRSFRTNDYREMISHDEEYASVEGSILYNESKDLSENRLRVYLDKKGKEYRIDGNKTDQAEFYGKFGCVSLTNRDMSIIRGTPDDRRRFLDRAISIMRPFYFGLYLEFKRIVLQRNSLLKKSRESGKPAKRVCEEISPWNRTLAKAAAEIMAERESYISRLDSSLNGHYRALFEKSG
ncbi:MAG: DNA replication and repair protein RecF, partial [Ignavibacteria bacterium]|nr:DNA replication and repair protein RecF [Ignavibacteria bacterium]